MYVAYGLVIKLNLFIIADSHEQIDIEFTSPWAYHFVIVTIKLLNMFYHCGYEKLHTKQLA